jgi:hypothetical protein
MDENKIHLTTFSTDLKYQIWDMRFEMTEIEWLILETKEVNT